MKSIGIIAGAGSLPLLLAEALRRQSIMPFIVTLKGAANPDDFKSYETMTGDLAKAGTIIKALKKRGIFDLVLIGGLARPNLRDIRPDMKTALFLMRVGLRSIGDNGVLVALRQELERDGFTLHGAHVFLSDLITPEGVLTKTAPQAHHKADIALGLSESQKLGRDDVGQAIIIHDGKLAAKEGKAGTDAMIAGYEGPKGAILVKTCKPQQDRDLDLPTIGVQTVNACCDKGFSGIALHAGASFFLDQEQSIAQADAHHMFITGEHP